MTRGGLDQYALPADAEIAKIRARNERLASLPKVGFWKPVPASWGIYEGSGEMDLPAVETSVDPTWDASEREIVLSYVRGGKTASQYRGWSDCRMCGVRNGSADLTDDSYVWPEGFAHYIEKHAVRPPSDFVEHCLRAAAR